jgi:hypothetical protein
MQQKRHDCTKYLRKAGWCFGETSTPTQQAIDLICAIPCGSARPYNRKGGPLVLSGGRAGVPDDPEMLELWRLSNTRSS